MSRLNLCMSLRLEVTDDRSTPSKRTANGGPTSLIDFEGDLSGSQVSTSSKDGDGTGNLLDDLAGLSFNGTPSTFGQGGSIALGQDTSILLSDFILQ